MTSKKEKLNKFIEIIESKKENKAISFYKKGGFNPSWSGNQALIKCAVHKLYKLLFILMDDERIDPTCKNYIIMDILFDNSNIDIISKYLLHKRIPPSANHNKGLIRLCEMPNTYSTFKELCDKLEAPPDQIYRMVCGSLKSGNLDTYTLIGNKYANTIKPYSFEFFKYANYVKSPILYKLFLARGFKMGISFFDVLGFNN